MQIFYFASKSVVHQLKILEQKRSAFSQPIHQLKKHSGQSGSALSQSVQQLKIYDAKKLITCIMIIE
jgi:hypothetical protein